MPTEYESTTSPIRIAVMGTGRWGKNLVRVIDKIEDATLSWIVDPDPQNLAIAHSLAPSARAVSHIQETRFDFDAAVIATPANDHVAHARELLTQKKHTFVEKPAGVHISAVTDLCTLSAHHQRVLMAGHQLLYHPGFEALRALVRQGRIGRVGRIEATRSALLDLPKEPGVLWSLGPHDIAMILELLDQSPHRIDCRISPRGEPFKALKANLCLYFDAGVTADITLISSSKKRRRLRVYAEKGLVDFDDAEAGGNVTVHPHDDAPYPLNFPRIEPLKQEMRHFVHAIRQGVEPLSGCKHILSVTHVLNDCQHAVFNPLSG